MGFTLGYHLKIQRKNLAIFVEIFSLQMELYISYNTLPGWHQFSNYREMMKYHASKMTSLQDKIEQSKAIIQFAAEHVLSPNESYGQFLREHSDFISNLSDEYLFHEYLEDHNEALYFHQLSIESEHQNYNISETVCFTHAPTRYSSKHPKHLE